MESTENLTPLNVEQLTNLLSRAYLAMVRSGTPFQKFPSVMLWGPPGVGNRKRCGRSPPLWNKAPAAGWR